MCASAAAATRRQGKQRIEVVRDELTIVPEHALIMHRQRLVHKQHLALPNLIRGIMYGSRVSTTMSSQARRTGTPPVGSHVASPEPPTSPATSSLRR